MHNVFLIARREYRERVRTKAFMIITLLVPLALAGFIFVVGFIVNLTSHGTKHLIVVASSQRTAETIRAHLARGLDRQNRQITEGRQQPLKQAADRPSELNVDSDVNTSPEERRSLTQKVRDKQLDGVVWATDEALASAKIPFITRDASSFIQNAKIEESVGQALHREALRSKGLSDQEIDIAMKRVELDPQDVNGNGVANPQVTFIITVVMVFLLYMSLIMYGVNVMRAVLEEKMSRIMEVMLSVAQAKEMMAGKILGVGAVGLTQFAIWIAAAAVLTGLPIAAAAGLKGAISIKAMVAFPVFYLLGYTLYSTLFAAMGAMVNSEQEAQPMQIIVMLPLVLTSSLMFAVMESPNSPLALWASMFPLTSPVVMFMRIALQTPQWWQIALSVGVCIATIYGMILLCGRIYRVGILMYGKKPTLPEIMKWIRYA